MLHDAGEVMKPSLVRALSPFAGDDIAGILIDLLEKNVGSNPEIRDNLFGNICRILGQCRSSAARRILKKVLREHSAGAIVLEDESRQAAQVALAQLELDLPPESDTQQPPKDSSVRKVVKKMSLLSLFRLLLKRAMLRRCRKDQKFRNC